MNITITNKETSLCHIKGGLKSFQSRQVKGADRIILGEKLSDMSFPSKEFHRRLASLDEKSFLSGNLKNVPISKNVLKQCSYEYRKSQLVDDSLIKSLQILQSR